MKRLIISALFLYVIILPINLFAADKEAQCEGYNIEIWKEEWKWKTFQDNFEEASLCEISDLLKGARKSAQEKVTSMAAAFAKKAAISYLNGVTGGAFSMFMGSMEGSDSSLAQVVAEVDQIVAEHFAKAYRQKFNDKKSAYFAAYNEYLTGTGGYPFGAMVERAKKSDLTHFEEQQFRTKLDYLVNLDKAGNALINTTGIFGPESKNRFKAANVYMLIGSQRLAVWKELDFAQGFHFVQSTHGLISTLQEMHEEFLNWLVTSHIPPLKIREERESRHEDEEPGVDWRYDYRVTIGGQVKFWRHYVCDDRNNYSCHEFKRKALEEAKKFRQKALCEEYTRLFKEFFGEDYDQILSNWVKVVDPDLNSGDHVRVVNILQDDIYIDHAESEGGSGTSNDPFNTIGKALDCVNTGGTIWINPGNYNEAITITRPMRLRSTEDAVIIKPQ